MASTKQIRATKARIQHAEDGRYASVTLAFKREAGQWAGWCVELDVATNARRFEDAVHELGDLIGLYINALEDEGDVERIMKARGVVISAARPTAPSILVPKDDTPNAFYRPHVQLIHTTTRPARNARARQPVPA
jgi:hypothetical protein